MGNPNEPVTAALIVIEALEKLGVPYLVGGSLASATYGEFRASADADLLVDLQPEHVYPLVDALSKEMYANPDVILDAIRQRSSFNFIPFNIAGKVDIFIVRDRPFDRSQLARRVSRIVSENPPRPVYIASPEDTILAKLEWYRLGHEVSERQWRDILGVIKVRTDQLDRDYLARWAAELGVADLLERAYREA